MDTLEAITWLIVISGFSGAIGGLAASIVLVVQFRRLLSTIEKAIEGSD